MWGSIISGYGSTASTGPTRGRGWSREIRIALGSPGARSALVVGRPAVRAVVATRPRFRRHDPGEPRSAACQTGPIDGPRHLPSRGRLGPHRSPGRLSQAAFPPALVSSSRKRWSALVGLHVAGVQVALAVGEQMGAPHLGAHLGRVRWRFAAPRRRPGWAPPSGTARRASRSRSASSGTAAHPVSTRNSLRSARIFSTVAPSTVSGSGPDASMTSATAPSRRLVSANDWLQVRIGGGTSVRVNSRALGSRSPVWVTTAIGGTSASAAPAGPAAARRITAPE